MSTRAIVTRVQVGGLVCLSEGCVEICISGRKTEELYFNTGHIGITRAEIALPTRPEGAAQLFHTVYVTIPFQTNDFVWLLMLNLCKLANI